MNAYDYLGGLDPESPQAAAAQIANHLRAAILTKKLGVGEPLPSNKDLRERYGVARETIKRAIEILDRERLIVTQQGRSPRVRATIQKAVELRPHLEEAFREQHVTIDFAGFSSETLGDSLAEILDKVRIGRYPPPESVTVRILVPDMSKPLVLPAAVEDDKDAAVKARMARITNRSLDIIADQMDELQDLGLISSATAQFRFHELPPVFKLYLINRKEAFFGFYPVVRRQVTIRGEQVEMYDPMGKDADLLHFAEGNDEGAHDGQFIRSSQAWFNSVWELFSHEPSR